MATPPLCGAKETRRGSVITHHLPRIVAHYHKSQLPARRNEKCERCKMSYRTDSSSTVKSVRQRANHSKSRTGCYTCKQRRVKCDEVKPVCLRCQSAARECLSDPRQPKQIRTIPRATVSAPLHGIPVALDTDAQSAMSYFCHSTLPAFQQCEPSPLWEYMKQELYHSPSMCFMAIAIGYEHQSTRAPSSSSSTQSPIFNTRAVQSLRQTIEDAEADSTSSTMFTVVFHSLLLVILHCFRKSFTEVGIHLEHGLRIAWEATMRYDMATEVPLRESLRLLKQYCIAMALFNPLLPQQAVHSARNFAPNQALANPESLKSGSGPLAVSADDQVVQGELEDLILDLIGTTLTTRRPHIDLDAGGDLTFAEPLTVEDALLEKISAFRARHVALEAAIDRRLASKTVQRAQQFKLAKARCMTIGVYIRCRWSGYQCHFDVEMETFSRIIDLAETYLAEELQRTADGSGGRSEPLVFLGHGLISTLSFVSRICRQQELRHRALKVMERCEGQDGPWSSELAVLICKAVIAYEERKALQDDPSFAITGYIPEHCRVRYYYYYNEINERDDGTRREILRVFRMRQGSQNDFVHEDIDLDK